MELTNIHPAEAYLRNEQNPSFLYIRIYGERRKLFINRGGENAIGIIAKGKRKRGYIFTDWDNIEKIYTPSQDNEKDRNRKLLLKYQRLARLATHTNNWLRKIAVADPEKSLYENHITTGTVIDGMCISLARIEKYCGSTSMALIFPVCRRQWPLYFSIPFSTCRASSLFYSGVSAPFSRATSWGTILLQK